VDIDEYGLHERVTALERVAVDLRTLVDGSGALGPHLAKLEQIAADLRALIGPTPRPWWKKMVISPDLQEDFEEAMRLGREFRKTGRIPDEEPTEPST
jgi:hypothetical protein